MMRSKVMFSVLALVAPFAIVGALSWAGVGEATASPETTSADLCLATGIDHAPTDPSVGSGGCQYSSRDVPKLKADVCWNDGVATLKGEGACVGRARQYHVVYGEVIDPTSLEVVAYAPLIDSCSVVDCVPSSVDPGPLEDDVACCDPYTGNCSPANSDGECTVGEWTWCTELEVVDDDTVICHD